MTTWCERVLLYIILHFTLWRPAALSSSYHIISGCADADESGLNRIRRQIEPDIRLKQFETQTWDLISTETACVHVSQDIRSTAKLTRWFDSRIPTVSERDTTFISSQLYDMNSDIRTSLCIISSFLWFVYKGKKFRWMILHQVHVFDAGEMMLTTDFPVQTLSGRLGVRKLKKK